MTHCPLPISEVFERAGGRAALARAIGIDPSYPYQWRRVPAHHAVAVGKLLGVEPHELRPDVFPAAQTCIGPVQLPNHAGENAGEVCAVAQPGDAP